MILLLVEEGLIDLVLVLAVLVAVVALVLSLTAMFFDLTEEVAFGADTLVFLTELRFVLEEVARTLFAIVLLLAEFVKLLLLITTAAP